MIRLWTFNIDLRFGGATWTEAQVERLVEGGLAGSIVPRSELHLSRAERADANGMSKKDYNQLLVSMTHASFRLDISGCNQLDGPKDGAPSGYFSLQLVHRSCPQSLPGEPLPRVPTPHR